MGFWDTITDLVDAATPWSVADAEAPEETKVRSPLCGSFFRRIADLGRDHGLVKGAAIGQ